MSRARYSFDWESQIKLSTDPQKARIIREERATKTVACSREEVKEMLKQVLA